MKDKLKKNKLLIGVAALAVIGILAGFIRMPGGGNANASAETVIRTTVLEKGQLAATVSATGTVYSTDATNVYSNLNYQVKKVYVSIGDKVNAGDVLAELDTSSLETDIAQKNASINASQAKAGQDLASAQRDLETYKRNLEENYDSGLLKAQSDLRSAEESVESARRDVELKELDLQSANTEWNNARRKLRDAKEDGESTDTELDDLRAKIRSAEISVSKAEANLESAKAGIDKAEASLEEKKKSLEATSVSADDSIETYQDKVKSAQISNNFEEQRLSLQKLQSDLEACVITAPVSGTVTAVSAVEGASGSGLLFVIQDADSLKVIANIKEYDIASVAIGNKVTVKSDATGDKTFEGKLSKIAPTSTETTTGSAAGSTDAEYESEVTIASKGGGLKIGMNARLSIITEEKNNIYYVPYEAIGTGRDGSSYIWAAKQQEDGKYTAEAVTVTTGLETDLYTEISGDGLSDGLIVVRDASSVQAGDEIAVQTGGKPEGAGSRPEGASGGMRMQSGGGAGGGVRVQMGG